VELAQERALPQAVELVLRVHVRLALGRLAAEGRGERRDKLEVVEEDLGEAVVALDRAVRGGRAAASARGKASAKASRKNDARGRRERARTDRWSSRYSSPVQVGSCLPPSLLLSMSS